MISIESRKIVWKNTRKRLTRNNRNDKDDELIVDQGKFTKDSNFFCLEENYAIEEDIRMFWRKRPYSLHGEMQFIAGPSSGSVDTRM